MVGIILRLLVPANLEAFHMHYRAKYSFNLWQKFTSTLRPCLVLFTYCYSIVMLVEDLMEEKSFKFFMPCMLILKSLLRQQNPRQNIFIEK